ncbi:putative acetate kinase [Aspergillus tanneri]|uniref:Acetate kinase n=1 Tax=Aspergillus tanneri TaxID=1220188 RepID=A0A5M9MGT1_9EURO|nr:uncharacterized protein ATNIH1004_007618 [Aspergillus tanneri]KAA8646192.1 hypothetical protein ATNIH1004_007618 [Aspergillus tanneri]
MARKSILAVNAGSSSVKITFYTFEQSPKVIANAQISGITAPPPTLKCSCGSTQHKEELKETLATPQDAFEYLIQRCLSDHGLSEVTSSEDLAYICHRVVHGGDYNSDVVMDDETYHHLEELEDLAPLHNFSALEIIRTCRKDFPSVKGITFFDTAFHQTLPDYVKTYPINQEVAKTNKLRKYGFHGISYSFILRSVAEFLNKPREQTNLIALHIGSGASAEEILNKKSGWKALTGTTDFSRIAVETPPSAEHRLAFDVLVDRILGYMGSYFVKLGGKVDAVVFAGGIGEKSALLRRTVIEKCACLSFAIDSSANDKGPADDQIVTNISKGTGNGPQILVCQTDEQYEMAYKCITKYGPGSSS